MILSLHPKGNFPVDGFTRIALCPAIHAQGAEFPVEGVIQPDRQRLIRMVLDQISCMKKAERKFGATGNSPSARLP